MYVCTYVYLDAGEESSAPAWQILGPVWSPTHPLNQHQGLWVGVWGAEVREESSKNAGKVGHWSGFLCPVICVWEGDRQKQSTSPRP